MTIFNIFDDLRVAYSCLQAETFFVETSDIMSFINEKKFTGTLWQKIFHINDIFSFRWVYICYNVIVR